MKKRIKKVALKHCPFCGGNDIDVRGWTIIREYFVVCNGCGSSTSERHKSARSAIKAWNMRAAATAAQKEKV